MSLDWLRPYLEEKGELTIQEYMELCLYHPQHGYYTTLNPLGRDFITAPEVSQMFGEMIGLCFMDLWLRMERPSRIHLIEMGPGQGTLMADLLRIVKPEFKGALDVHMVEVSPVLTKIQQDRLNSPATWHSSLTEALLSCIEGPTFFIANELFDAFPIEQSVQTAAGWVPRKVRLSIDQKSLEFIPTPDPDQVVQENCPGAKEIIQQIAAHIHHHQGMALIIDYGYVGPASGDTLQALKNHQFHPILQDPGQADLTAHVNFGQLMNFAEERNIILCGPTTQGSFLTELGIHLRADMLRKNATPRDVAQIDSAMHRLIDPSQMGNLFKVLALIGQRTPQPVGFQQCIKAAS